MTEFHHTSLPAGTSSSGDDSSCTTLQVLHVAYLFITIAKLSRPVNPVMRRYHGPLLHNVSSKNRTFPASRRHPGNPKFSLGYHMLALSRHFLLFILLCIIYTTFMVPWRFFLEPYGCSLKLFITQIKPYIITRFYARHPDNA